jgi:hypothetical protein
MNIAYKYPTRLVLVVLFFRPRSHLISSGASGVLPCAHPPTAPKFGIRVTMEDPCPCSILVSSRLGSRPARQARSRALGGLERPNQTTPHQNENKRKEQRNYWTMQPWMRTGELNETRFTTAVVSCARPYQLWR